MIFAGCEDGNISHLEKPMESGTPGHEKKCRYCIGSDWVRRSRFCWYDAPLWLLGFCPYRCMICFRRFYASGRRWDFTKAAL